jgi:RNA polymerase sigma factor (sigma-70 family)
MAIASFSATLQRLHRLLDGGAVAGLSDAQLMERFAGRRDEAAFEALVSRHGAMVWSVCRGVLGNREDSEDAFQETFLVLIRHAARIDVRDSLAGWLHQVARRIAVEAAESARRRRARERVIAERCANGSLGDFAYDNVASLIHQEIERLPEKYRVAILLCDIEDLTRDEASGRLGWPSGTVAGRLARGRRMLRDRLVRRGVQISMGPLIVISTIARASAAALESPTRAVMALARGAAVSGRVSVLATCASRGLIAARLKPLALLAIATGVIVGIVTAKLMGRATAENALEPASATDAQLGPIDPGDPAQAHLYAGRVVDQGGNPIAGARLYLVPRQREPKRPTEVRGLTDAAGRFRFEARDMTHPEFDGLPSRIEGLLIAEADGYGPDWVETVVHDQTLAAEWVLTLSKEDIAIEGQTLDAKGQPIAGVTVQVTAIFVPHRGNIEHYLE